MTTAKIDFSFGSLSFSGEGEEKWLAGQLDKILQAAPKLSELHAPSDTPDPTGAVAPAAKKPTGKFTESLASYIKSKGGESNQSKRFLATADWLRQKGAESLTAAAISKALTDNHQKKLGNPADCLNKNCARGFCEKTGKSFYITPEGLKELGHDE